MVSTTDIAAMNAKETAVRKALEKAEAEARAVSVPADIATVFSVFNPLASFLPSILRTDAQAAALKNVQAARARYEQWADGSTPEGWRTWVQQGHDDTWGPYPVSFWMRIGDDLLSELGVHVQALVAGGNAAVVRNTATQTAKDVKAKAEAVVAPLTEPWPLRWKVAAGMVGGVVVLGLGTVLVVELKPLLAFIPKGGTSNGTAS